MSVVSLAGLPTRAARLGCVEEVRASLLDWARRGLRLLFVHGTREVRLLMQDAHHEYPRAAARTQGLGAVVAKRLDSPYLPGRRSRLWLTVNA